MSDLREMLAFLCFSFLNLSNFGFGSSSISCFNAGFVCVARRQCCEVIWVAVERERNEIMVANTHHTLPTVVLHLLAHECGTQTSK